MDLDVISNCSSHSAHSEEIRSNASTLSGLSIYQNEFAELRHLINPTKYPSPTFDRCSTPKQDSGCGLQYDETIHTPSFVHNSQDTRHTQEKYKLDLYNLEKTLELKYYEKIEKLLKANHLLRSELDNANEQITRLLKASFGQGSSSENLFKLEREYHDLTLRYSELQQSYYQNKNDKEESENENKQLKIDVGQLRIEIDAKNECIKEFKEKVSQQYVHIDTLLKNNLKLSQNLNAINSELTHVQKTRDWYKERLRLYQNDKQELSREILKCQTEACSQEKTIHILNVELSKWKAKYDDVKLEALKDREKLRKEFESTLSLQNRKIEEHTITPIENTNDMSVINYYESTIQDLTCEIVKIKEYVQEQDNLIHDITKENAKLIAQCITLQKKIRHNELSIEELEYVKKQLNAELNELKNDIKKKSDELVDKEHETLILQAELTTKRDEQAAIEKTVKTLRQQFTIFKSNYRELKDELAAKSKQILQVENEKQKLFMENNWNVCEIEKLKEKEFIINELKSELTRNRKIIDEHLKTIKSMEKETVKNHEQNLLIINEKQCAIEESKSEISKYENVLVQYKKMVTNYENQITDLQKRLNESNAKLGDYRDSVEILKQEINRRDFDLSDMSIKNKELENEIKCYMENMQFAKIPAEENSKFQNGHDHHPPLQCFVNSVDATDSYDNQEVKEKNSVPLEYNNSETVENCEVTTKTPSMVNMNKHLRLKITVLEDRINKLSKTSDNCCTVLNNLFSAMKDDKDKVQKLNVLLHVKELELKEKQKKYETNNRTLLRKVKEHMKGRNSAEKQNKYLQEMYNSLSDENNSLKLEVKSKEDDVERIKSILDKYTNFNEKLKLSVMKLEEQLSRSRSCDKCASSNEMIETLEKHVKEFENEKLICQNILQAKENTIIDLQKEVQHLSHENTSTNRDNKKLAKEMNSLLQDKEVLTTTVGSLEEEIKIKESLIEQLKREIVELSETVLANNCLESQIDEKSTQVEYLTNELKILNSRLQMKSDELTELNHKKSKMEIAWLEKEKDFQNIIDTSKRYVHDLQSEIDSINSEKNFLQRLCNDLKLALNSHVNHNKMLKQQLNMISKEKDFNSLPNVLPNVPCDIKYDEDYINQLLQQNKSPLKGKPITEMKSCLDTLKREILTLQEQIARKNIQY